VLRVCGPEYCGPEYCGPEYGRRVVLKSAFFEGEEIKAIVCRETDDLACLLVFSSAIDVAANRPYSDHGRVAASKKANENPAPVGGFLSGNRLSQRHARVQVPCSQQTQRLSVSPRAGEFKGLANR
jgi:hypothetical protein